MPAVRVPRHVAIIMDGNGRWAQRRGLPRVGGHRAGLKAVRTTIERCSTLGVEVLTLFAFSSENWQRPRAEVSFLMDLFLHAIDGEIDELAAKGIRLRFVGERSQLAPQLAERMNAAEARTASNLGLTLVIAVAYGGRLDILTAVKRLVAEAQCGSLTPAEVTEQRFGAELALAGLPEPDLFVRTGGERRISNFLLWNLAYTELWFTDKLWPDFNAGDLDEAIEAFGLRERRFGLTSSQLADPAC